MFSKTSQTATEYLIILAVIIVISLIVVGVMGGIPSIGGGSSKRTHDITLATQKVGIEKYAIQDSYVKLIVKNNNAFVVRVTELYFAGISCESEDIPFSLNIGQRKTIICTNINSTLVSEKENPSLNITYTNRETSAVEEITI